MKFTAVLVVSLVLLFLGSPLLGLENPASPDGKGPVAENATLLFTDQSAQAAPLQCADSIPAPDLRMTARECSEVFGCCVCRQRVPGMGCIDWQGC